MSACLDSPRPSLDQLALKHGTDKGSRNGSRPGLDYCNQYYEPMLAPFRDRPIKLLEIGIKQGDSLRMWQEYFSEALIYGIDVNPQAMISNQERILTFCGEQQDTRFLEQIVRDDGPFDFVIDDGGHWAEHQLVSLRFFAPHVRRIYFIEDLWNGHIHGGDAFIEALSSDLSKIAYGESSMWRSVHLHPHFVALEKKGARDS